MAFKKVWCALTLGFLLPFSCAHTDFFTSIGEACFGVAKEEFLDSPQSSFCNDGLIIQGPNWHRTKLTS